MTSRGRSRFGAAAALALLPAAPALAKVERFQGQARLSDGRLAYVEEHDVRRDGERIVDAETRYLSPDGRLIARLRSDYSRDPFAPEYVFEDFRTGTAEAVRWNEGSLEMSSNGKSRLLSPPEAVPVVAGQGLDRFARSRLEDLARGAELRVELALPSRLDSYGFRLRAAGEGRDDSAIRVRIEPSSFLLRLLAPSIEADYEPGTGRLLRYRGVSNLSGDQGETRQVEILYRYADDDSST
jgi:hypothetical protein